MQVCIPKLDMDWIGLGCVRIFRELYGSDCIGLGGMTVAPVAVAPERI